MQDIYKKTKEFCRLYNITPARSRGQNFLIKEEIYNKIIKTAEIKKDDVILEVGPGFGFLTAKLAQKAEKVIAVELDNKIAEILKTGFIAQGVDNIKVVNENILDLEINTPLAMGGRGKYKIVANLPYNITSVFLKKFLSAENKPELMVLMLQREVAERICARPGKMSLLAVSVQFYAEPEIIAYAPAEDFWPQPEVDSAIIKIKIKSSPPFLNKGGKNEKDFFRLVKIGFSARRKMLKNNLANGYHITQTEAEERLKQAGFSPKIRAQELSVADWKKLLVAFC
jgi:16S rRNA (adenine1518-N6/adenine1519-N6)-dimethyltransferase